jgi:hypothetical protein
MTITTTRLLVILAMVLAVHGIFLWVQQGGMPTDIRAPYRDLNDLPFKLGDWKGEKAEVDPRMTDATEAYVVVDRDYQDGVNPPIRLHFNAMRRYFMGIEHQPQHCYTTHGAELVEKKPLELSLPDGSKFRAELMSLKEEDVPFLVLFWYQLGDQIVLDDDEQRTAREELRGQKTWPPLIKVLLQTTVRDAKQDEQRLTDFGKLVYAWTRDVDRPPADGSPTK